MYNRYIRNDRGVYTRIPEEDHPPLHHQPDGRAQPNTPPHHGPERAEEHRHAPPPPPGAERPSDSITQFLRRILDRFHLENVDTGDLLLLLLLFLLFEEDADEELLFALGLLLIL